MKKKLKIGVALGSGAAYGVSSVGALKVLDEKGIHIDVIAGTSMGAVIGSLYASGLSSKEIEDEILSMDWNKLLDFVVPEKGFVSGNKIENYLRDILEHKKFEDLKIPLYVTAVDLKKGRLVVFNKGDIATAVRASISIPGIFTPVDMSGMRLVDGGVLDPLPTDIVKKRSDFVIAIDHVRELQPASFVNAKPQRSELYSKIKRNFVEAELKYIEDYLKQGKLSIPLPFRWIFSPRFIYRFFKNKEVPFSTPEILSINRKASRITSGELARLKFKLNPPDVLIKCDTSNMHWMEFDKSVYAIKQGELAARKKMRKIMRVLSNFRKR